jgi:hypothetical protein
MRVGRAGAVLVVGLSMLAGSNCDRGDKGSDGSASEPADEQCGLEGGGRCAPVGKRVDRGKPVFSRPTEITNPLFPTATLTQVIQLGQEACAKARVEVTLMPGTKVVEWDGQKVETVVRQYIAYSGPRIVEVALDYFAQADDGSVWYFGEDVFNYEDGVVADMGGTWLAGKDGPAGMIMPAQPEPGDVYRPENVPGLVFEEVTVRAVGQTIEGPRGPVPGGITTREHLMEGDLEDKAFAPGYGESRIQAEDELVQVALALPTDAVPGAPAAELRALSTGAVTIFEAAGKSDWTAASTALETVSTAWHTYEASEVPKLLGAQAEAAVNGLSGAVGASNVAATRQAAVDLARAALDLELRHRTPAEVDGHRLGAWGRQILVDSEAGDAAAVAGDVAILETIRNRMVHTLDAPVAERLGQILTALRQAADAKDRAAAAEATPALVVLVAGLGPPSR